MESSYELNTGQLYKNFTTGCFLFDELETQILLIDIIYKIAKVQKVRGYSIPKEKIAEDQWSFVFSRKDRHQSFEVLPRYFEDVNTTLNDAGNVKGVDQHYYELTKDLIVSPATKEYPELFLYYITTYPDVYTLDQFLRYQATKCCENNLDLLFLLQRAISEETIPGSRKNFENERVQIAQEWLSNNRDSCFPSVATPPTRNSTLTELTAREWIFISKCFLRYLGADISALSKADKAKFALTLSQKPVPSSIQNSDIYKQYDKELKDEKLKLKYLRSVARYFELYKHTQIVERVKSDISDLEESTRKGNI